MKLWGGGMTKKRFENRLNKNSIKFNTLNPVWDNKKKDGLNVFEMCNEMNRLQEKIDELEKILQWHEDVVNEFFINNELKLTEDIKQDAHLTLGIEFEYEVEND